MRIRLTLSHPNNSAIPINYAYPISAMIYKKLGQADSELAAWLHEKGWSARGKRFKLFCFGRLRPKKYFIPKHSQKRFILEEGPTSLTLSFYVDDTVQRMVQALFEDHRFSLGDKLSSASFEVEAIEVAVEPAFSERMRFRLETGIVIGHQKGGQRLPTYLHPLEDRKLFKQQLLGNLIAKYESYHGPMPPALASLAQNFSLNILNEPKSRMTIIKSFTKEQTHIRSYVFDFEIVALPELIRTGYLAGFGEKGSMGFGFANILT